MIRRDSSLRDVAFEVCTALERSGLPVVLVGGSAATFYAPTAYQSLDLDFVAQFAADRSTEVRLVEVLASLGYELSGNIFSHVGGNPFTLEFPKGPPAVGGEVLREFRTFKEGDRMLRIVTPLDCVRDRLAHYFFWNDQTALEAAIGVAKAVREGISLAALREWLAEVAEDSKIEHPDIPEKARRFLNALNVADHN